MMVDFCLYDNRCTPWIAIVITSEIVFVIVRNADDAVTATSIGEDLFCASA